jgi:hypothetical protein
VLSDILPSKLRNRPGSTTPTQTVMPPEEYRNLYFRAGFEQVEIIDASEECNTGFKQHTLCLLRDKWRTGRINWQTFQRRRSKTRQNDLGYYLLVCAQKGVPSDSA